MKKANTVAKQKPLDDAQTQSNSHASNDANEATGTAGKKQTNELESIGQDLNHFTVPGSTKVYNRKAILVVLLVPLMMSLLQVSAVNTMLTPMAATIGADAVVQQWILSGYALAIGITLIPAGRIGDIFGRSAVFMIGLVVFTVASLLIGTASTAVWINMWRIVQGIGAGIYSPQISGLITQYFRGKQRATAFSMMGLVIAVAVAAGPLISGFSIQAFGEALGWRVAFLVNVPVGIIGIIVASQLLPFGKERQHFGEVRDMKKESSRGNAKKVAVTQREKIDLDPLGMFILTLSVLCIMLPFMLHVAWGWWLLPAAPVLIAAWIVWEQSYKAHGHQPMVDLALFRIKSFSYASAISLVQFLGLPSIFAVVAIYLQNGFGVPALEVAFVTLPNALVSAVASVWAGRLVYRHGAGVLVLGMGLNLTGVLGIILVVFGINHGDLNYWWISAPISVMGLGQGMFGSASNTVAMMDMPAQNAGTAGGIFQTGQRIATAIGIAIITAIVFATVGDQPTVGDWNSGFTAGLTVTAVIVVVALGLAVVYWRINYRRRIREALEKGEQRSKN